MSKVKVELQTIKSKSKVRDELQSKDRFKSVENESVIENDVEIISGDLPLPSNRS